MQQIIKLLKLLQCRFGQVIGQQIFPLAADNIGQRAAAHCRHALMAQLLCHRQHLFIIPARRCQIVTGRGHINDVGNRHHFAIELAQPATKVQIRFRKVLGGHIIVIWAKRNRAEPAIGTHLNFGQQLQQLFRRLIGLCQCTGAFNQWARLCGVAGAPQRLPVDKITERNALHTLCLFTHAEANGNCLLCYTHCLLMPAQ